ncbi:class I SAM-dependent methyltransferase, partial [Mycobacterium kansasii]
ALLRMHPTAHATVTDVERSSVAAIAASDLGDHPRALVGRKDATAIDAPDGAYHLAVIAMSFHHLTPARASRVFAEGTRVAEKLLIIDV